MDANYTHTALYIFVSNGLRVREMRMARVSNTLTKVGIHCTLEISDYPEQSFQLKLNPSFPPYTTNINPVTLIISCPIYQTGDINVIARTRNHAHVISKLKFYFVAASHRS